MSDNYLPKVAIALAGIISFASLYAGLNTTSTTGLVVAPSIQDFGTVQQGAVLTHSVDLHNLFEDQITLTQALGSCKCVAAGSCIGQVIPAGGVLAVPITWDITGKRGSVSADMVFEYSRVSSVSTNDASNSFVTFRAVANVEPEYFSIPERLVFGGSNPDSISLRIYANNRSSLRSARNLHVVDFGSYSDAITVTISDAVAGVIANLQVHFDAECWAKRGFHSGKALSKIEVVTDSPFEPVLVIPVEIEAVDHSGKTDDLH